MRGIIQQRGSSGIVYVDESGFAADSYRPYAWASRGKKSYGERSGRRGVRTNLIVAKRGKTLIAPVLYEGSTSSSWFNQWLEGHLIPVLEAESTVILDNAAFHKKEEVRAILAVHGHDVLFLPPYSPDLNPIEQDFAALKKRRQYAPKNTTIDTIVNEYGSFLE